MLVANDYLLITTILVISNYYLLIITIFKPNLQLITGFNYAITTNTI